jgi:CRP-like cAMP-binding protein
VRIGFEAAAVAVDTVLERLDVRSAAGAMVPTLYTAHGRNNRRVSPRHVPATVTELTRCALLTELPGDRLNELARRMTREELPAGAAPVVEGEEGDRFYVVLSGVLAASKYGGRGAAGVLHPGAYFGEVSLAMGVPRTASVRAMTPSVVASCDKATFDEFILPLFTDEA